VRQVRDHYPWQNYAQFSGEEANGEKRLGEKRPYFVYSLIRSAASEYFVHSSSRSPIS
jgi:hypothetical protein